METLEKTYTISTENDIALTYYSTTDYEKFSLIYFNRPVTEEKVNKIVKLVTEEGKNYFRLYPMIVNSNFEIMDGQHRHEAGKRTKLPITYIIDDEFQMEDAIIAVGATTNWHMFDFMESYAKRQFPEYVKINDFYQQFPWVKISIIPALCSSKGYSPILFQRGHYIADRIDHAHKVVATVNAFRPFIGDEQAEYKPFIQTLSSLIQNANYNHKRMIEKMKQRGSLFERCTSVEKYLIMLTEIYNYRVSPENRVMLSEYYIHSKWNKEQAKEKRS